MTGKIELATDKIDAETVPKVPEALTIEDVEEAAESRMSDDGSDYVIED